MQGVRSKTYAARWVAKNVVAAGFAEKCVIQLAYAIGVAKPLSLFVETYGTENGNLTAKAITDIVKINFDARPGALARDLALREPKYNVTAAYCHFGREPYTKDGIRYFSWEDPVDLSKYAGMKAADRWGVRTPTGIRPFSHKAQPGPKFTPTLELSHCRLQTSRPRSRARRPRS